MLSKLRKIIKENPEAAIMVGCAGCYVLGLAVGQRFADPLVVTQRSKHLWMVVNSNYILELKDRGMIFKDLPGIGDLLLVSLDAVQNKELFATNALRAYPVPSV